MKPCVFSLRRIVGKPLVADDTRGKRERPGMRPIIMPIVWSCAMGKTSLMVVVMGVVMMVEGD